ncbi:MAG: hypothetical protein WCO33_00140 [bacterium]
MEPIYSPKPGKFVDTYYIVDITTDPRALFQDTLDNKDKFTRLTDRVKVLAVLLTSATSPIFEFSAYKIISSRGKVSEGYIPDLYFNQYLSLGEIEEVNQGGTEGTKVQQ